ncbi:MAG: hypothetical protein ACLP0J_16135 [Solirubrobacteraceae bacterium]
MRDRALLRAWLITGLVLIPASAVAVPRAELARAPSPPQAGAWRISSGGLDDDNLLGSFTIGANRYLSGLHGTIQSDAETACGTGTVTVAGKHKIIDASGINPEGNAYSDWVVGRNQQNADPVIQPTRVRLIVGSEHIAGSLDLVFSNTRGQSAGDIYYYGGNCDLNFVVEPVKRARRR